jgi:hypothetical protein
VTRLLHFTCLLALSGLAIGCGEGTPEADPAAVDRHLNRIIAIDNAERANAVVEARAREDVREAAMEEKAANHSNAAD